VSDVEIEVSPDGQSSTYRYGATTTKVSASGMVDHALHRMASELDPYGAAANLITRWCEQDSEMRLLLSDAIEELEAREKRHEKRKGRNAKQQGSSLKVGDIALMATGMGPAFYIVRKIVTDAAGRVTAVSLSDPGKDNAGQAVAIQRIAAIFSNVLNKEK
jgi:hypothetical protein